MYANLRQPKMGEINCLKTKYKVKNINTKTRRKPPHSSQHFQYMFYVAYMNSYLISNF